MFCRYPDILRKCGSVLTVHRTAGSLAHHPAQRRRLLRPAALAGVCGTGDRLEPRARQSSHRPGGEIIGLCGSSRKRVRGSVHVPAPRRLKNLLHRLFGAARRKRRESGQASPEQAAPGPGCASQGVLRLRRFPGSAGRGPGCPRAVGAPRQAVPYGGGRSARVT